MAQKDKKTTPSKDWYSNKYQLILIQKNIFSLFTIFALIGVVISVFFVKSITESKSFEPFVIEMEDKTGQINVVENLTTSRLTADESVKRFYLYNFLKIAEGYNYATYTEDMVKLGLFANSTVYRQLMNRISSKNDRSPVNTIKEGLMTIGIKSMVFLTPKSVSIRFKVKNEKPNFYYPANRDLVAYIEFEFISLDLTANERLYNPLGFQVTKYRVDNDLVPNN